MPSPCEHRCDDRQQGVQLAEAGKFVEAAAWFGAAADEALSSRADKQAHDDMPPYLLLDMQAQCLLEAAESKKQCREAAAVAQNGTRDSIPAVLSIMTIINSHVFRETAQTSNKQPNILSFFDSSSSLSLF
eukprot:m.48411 g.48411  ORF g.48411 m.48411 type:complete len:131 (-) comp11996_c0_seq1:54-446(-)